MNITLKVNFSHCVGLLPNLVMRSDVGLGKHVPIVSDETTITISAEFKKRAIEHS